MSVHASEFDALNGDKDGASSAWGNLVDLLEELALSLALGGYRGAHQVGEGTMN